MADEGAVTGPPGDDDGVFPERRVADAHGPAGPGLAEGGTPGDAPLADAPAGNSGFADSLPGGGRAGPGPLGNDLMAGDGPLAGGPAGDDALGEALLRDGPTGSRPWPGGPAAGETTGDERVDAVVARLGGLAETPLEQHAALFGEVHDRLREVLGGLDAGTPEAGSQVLGPPR